MNIAVFASGKGSNFSAIISAVKRGFIKANLNLLVCDNPKAGVIDRAKKAGVKVALVRRDDYASKRDFENKIIEQIKKEKIGLIVLAGFMRMLSCDFVKKYPGCILNVHPALLPSFKGAHAIEDAFRYGVRLTGVTVHFVDEKMDHGPIILQEPVKINKSESLSSLEKKIHRMEHRLYPLAVKLFTEGKIKIKGRKVRVSVR